MYIGELARLTGATPKALRHYEALGLLGEVRRAGVYRSYTEHDASQVRLIRQAQALGFRLAELHSLLDGDNTDWAALSRLIDDKRSQLHSEMARLRQLDADLAAIGVEIDACLAA